MLFPIPFLPETIKIPFKKDNSEFRLRDSIKFATFFDHGAVFPHEGHTGRANFLMSVGAGIRIALSKFVTARVYVGVPLMNTKYYEQSNARVHFDLIVSPFYNQITDNNNLHPKYEQYTFQKPCYSVCR